jgi:hypothetical protein
MFSMTDTADPTLRGVDAHAASARGFFDIDPEPPSAFPPPLPTHPTEVVPTTSPALGVPQLPRVVAAVPSAAPASSFEFSPGVPSNLPSASAGRPKQQKRGGRRFVSWILFLAVVGAGVYAGITYGPDLVDRAKGDPTANEPEAPLAFPPVVATAVPARTATFVVEQPADAGTTIRYEITSDFETSVSRLLVDRATMPDIEVLAVFDIANLRQADQPNWWSMPRGTFPFVGGSERQRWLRTVEEYFPASMRPFVTVDAASESVIGTETMRHLVVTVDAAGLATSAATPVTDPTTGLQVPPPPPTPGEFVLPTGVTGSTEAIEPVTLEMWVDSNGMIRKLVEPASMGGRSITVTSLSGDAFSPTFPAPEAVVPLTADQLVDLAL